MSAQPNSAAALAVDRVVCGVDRWRGSGCVVVRVDPACVRVDDLIERLRVELERSKADAAVASPFMRGGRLREPSWWLRMLSGWTNRFLSLAAHGELFTLVGTACVFDGEALERALAKCPGRDTDSELLLECRRQGMRIVELPVALETDQAKASGSWWRALARATRQAWSGTRTGLRYRPALWLAVPGLIPGLLPLVAGVLVAMKSSVLVASYVIGATLVIQYVSLGIFSWQASTFAGKLLRRRA